MFLLKIIDFIDLIFFINCLLLYFIDYYDFFHFQTNSNIGLIKIFFCLVIVYFFYNYSSKGMIACKTIVKKNSSMDKWDTFIIKNLSEHERRYINSDFQIPLKKTVFTVLVIFIILLLHTICYCLIIKCNALNFLGKGLELIGIIFAFSIWHYISLQWKISLEIINKWKLYSASFI